MSLVYNPFECKRERGVEIATAQFFQPQYGNRPSTNEDHLLERCHFHLHFRHFGDRSGYRNVNSWNRPRYVPWSSVAPDKTCGSDGVDPLPRC